MSDHFLLPIIVWALFTLSILGLILFIHLSVRMKNIKLKRNVKYHLIPLLIPLYFIEAFGTVIIIVDAFDLIVGFPYVHGVVFIISLVPFFLFLRVLEKRLEASMAGDAK